MNIKTEKNMKQIRQIFIIGLACTTLVFVNGCKKYDEGPALSLKGKKARVANEWKIEYAYDYNDNIDVTSDYSGETWDFTKKGEFTEKDNGVVDKAGTWEFVSDKEAIQVNITGTGSSTETYTILKLKEKEMWLKDKDEELHLVPSK